MMLRTRGAQGRRHIRRLSKALVVSTAVAVVGACSLIGGEPDASSSSYKVVEPTPTPEPDPSESQDSTTPGATGPSPSPPNGEELIGAVKNRLKVRQTVTIDGVFYGPGRDEKLMQDDVKVELRSEGSVGGVDSQNDAVGQSKVTLTSSNGGKLEGYAIGFIHYVKFNKAYLQAVQAKNPGKLARHADTWLKMDHEKSPISFARPKVLIKDQFFGEGLTAYDAEKTSVKVTEHESEWAFDLTVYRAGSAGNNTPRSMLVTAKPEAPDPLLLNFGLPQRPSVLTFSKWDKTSDSFTAPPGAKTLKEGDFDDSAFTGGE